MGKIALDSFSPTHTAWLRYGMAAVTYLGVALFLKRGAPRLVHPRTPTELIMVLLLGLAPFAVSPILQLSGLASTQSIDNALIIAMEPMMTVLLGWVVLREGLNRSQWLSFAVAIFGFLLLARFDFRSFENLGNAHFLGSLMMLLALWGEAIYSVFGRILTRKYEPLPLFGTAIWVGFTALTLFALSREGMPNFSEAKWEAGLALLWLGPLGTCLSYILWIREARHAPVATLAVTLFIQPVLGAIIGAVFRDEKLIAIQWWGAALILTGVAIQARVEIHAQKKLAN